MKLTPRSALVWVFLVALMVYAWTYGGTLAGIVRKWDQDFAFKHGYLILPISLWLVWRMRRGLRDVELRPSWLGVIGLAGATAVWVIAKGTGVLVLEQFAAVAMIPAVVSAVLGLRLAWTIAFALGFLLFAVPFGRGLLPVLMQITADASTWMLHATGIPVFRSDMYLSIPYGDFEIAKACGGLNYFITGFVLGALYAHLNFHTWWKRLVCMAVFLVVPILANALRVYLIVVVSYLTEFRYGPGAEHIEFGYWLFIFVMLAMFWMGRRWMEDSPPQASTGPAVRLQQNWPTPFGWVAIAAATLVMLGGKHYFDSLALATRSAGAGAAGMIQMPTSGSHWKLLPDQVDTWQPHYKGGLVSRSAAYQDLDDGRVDVYVGVYGLGITAGDELIAYRNVLSESEHASLARTVVRSVNLGVEASFEVNEVIVQDGRGSRLVWHWFMVGSHSAHDPFVVKALEAWSLVSGGAESERVITLSTPLDSGAQGRLQAFVDRHSQCVAEGFDRGCAN